MKHKNEAAGILAHDNTQALAEAIASEMQTVRSVEGVYVVGLESGFQCWIVANHSTQEERYSVYDAEMGLLQQFPSLLSFHLVDREGRPRNEVITLERHGGWVELAEREYHA
jgi:hypothetical protein